MSAFATSARAAPLYAYVKGDAAEPDLLSALRDLTRHERRRLHATHRSALVEINPAREAILESIL